jgi:lysine decarboxylase
MWEMGLNLESADRDTLVCSVTLVDEDAFCDEAAGMLASLIEAARGSPRPAATMSVWRVEPDVVCTPHEAFFARRRRIPLEQAVGEVSAEQFCPYPPGVPIIAPGERITREAVETLRKSVGQVRIAYCSDPSLATVEVVDALQ